MTARDARRELVYAAQRYAKARTTYLRAYSPKENGPIIGLDQWDPIFTKWERRVLRAEDAMQKWKSRMCDLSMVIGPPTKRGSKP